jgi:hypothetical protein
MTVEDLEHIFRFQLYPPKPEEREENLYYMRIADGNKTIDRFDYNLGLDKLLPTLDNFVLDAYRDKMPVFIKPEIIQPL